MEKNHLPRCYNLSFDKQTLTLFLKVQKWTIAEVQKKLQNDTPLMNHFYKTHGGDKTLFENFGKKNYSFGYEECIAWHSEIKDEVIYSYIFTPVITITDEICDQCKGSKINSFDNSCYDSLLKLPLRNYRGLTINRNEINSLLYTKTDSIYGYQTVEYEAHTIIEPRLREKYIKMRD